MLSPKKSTLINSLLQIITSNASELPAAEGHNRPHHVKNYQSNISTRSSALLDYLLTKCCYSTKSSTSSSLVFSQITRRAKRLFRSLHKHDLVYLLSLVQNDGCNVGSCILTAQTKDLDEQSGTLLVDQQSDDIASPILTCILLRWPHLCMLDSSQMSLLCNYLRPLPWCSHSCLESDIDRLRTVCINPYHWSLQVPHDIDDHIASQQINVPTSPGAVLPPENVPSPRNEENVQSPDQYYAMPSSTPPPSYSEAFRQAGGVLSESNGPQKQRKWCYLAYWEYQDRIGCFYPVASQSVNIHVNKAAVDKNGDTLYLPKMFSSKSGLVPEQVLKVRSKIGLGVSLFRDDKCNVWLYNRSASTIFVNSHTMKPPDSLTCSNIRLSAKAVIRVQPGHIIKAYDQQLAQSIKLVWNNMLNESNKCPQSQENFFDFDSFRFSFVKGFGANYKNQNILQCPCWLEVILTNAN